LKDPKPDLIELITGREGIDSEQFFYLTDNSHGLRGHILKIRKVRSRSNTRKFFLSQLIVNEWNSLPQHIVDSIFINLFKNALNDFWRDMESMDVKS
jgi:hypothetical protein